MDVVEIESESEEWIHLAKDLVQWRTLVISMLGLRVVLSLNPVSSSIEMCYIFLQNFYQDFRYGSVKDRFGFETHVVKPRDSLM